MDPLNIVFKVLWKLYTFTSWKTMHKYIFTQSFALNFGSPLRINWIIIINHWLQPMFSHGSECCHALLKISFYSFVPVSLFVAMLSINITKVCLKILVLCSIKLVLIWKSTIKIIFKNWKVITIRRNIKSHIKLPALKI